MARSFNEKNISSGFQKTGIWSFNPSLMPATISKPSLLKDIRPKEFKIPLTSRAVCRIYRHYINAPKSPIIKKLFRAVELLLSALSIYTYSKAYYNHSRMRKREGKKANGSIYLVKKTQGLSYLVLVGFKPLVSGKLKKIPMKRYDNKKWPIKRL